MSSLKDLTKPAAIGRGMEGTHQNDGWVWRFGCGGVQRTGFLRPMIGAAAVQGSFGVQKIPPGAAIGRTDEKDADWPPF